MNKGHYSNFEVTGKINSNWHTGGIIGETVGGDVIIENCNNKVDIVGYNMAGGIIGYNNKAIIKNCTNYGRVETTGSAYGYSGTGGIIGGTNYRSVNDISESINYGEIVGTVRVGGIIGCSGGDTDIVNCNNDGSIHGGIEKGESYSGAGGIVGIHETGKLDIVNTYNKGDVIGQFSVGGILATATGTSWTAILDININNCFNIGDVESEDIVGGIIGRQWDVSAQNYLCINNSYNIGGVKGKRLGSNIGYIEYDSRTDTKTEFNNVYYVLEPAIGTGTLTSGEATKKTRLEIKSQEFVDLLNSNIGENADWKKWKQGEDGYPTFEN